MMFDDMVQLQLVMEDGDSSAKEAKDPDASFKPASS